MNKKIFSVLLVAAILFTGCGAKGGDNDNDKANAKQEETVNKNSVQAEIDKVESAASKIDEELQEGTLPQLDMNQKAYEMYDIWDEELNSLWGRLSNTLEGDEKQEVLDEQRQWIKRKEAEVTAAGKPCEGGSLQPFLESTTGSSMTRARCYVLASMLAKELGEEFTIPSDVQEDIDKYSATLDQVFEKFEGVYPIDEDGNRCIKVQRAADSDFILEDFLEKPEWIVSVSSGALLTDNDVISYTSETITFHAAQDSGMYYKLKESMEGSVELAYGESEDNMEDSIYTY